MAETKPSEAKPVTLLDELQANFKFIIVKDEHNPDIDHYVFNDGRQYKLQKPGFFERYTAVMDSKTPELSLLQLGLKCLFPENEKSPKINEEYLNKNSNEGWLLWRPLFRESL
jgi:hypothetical protein